MKGGVLLKALLLAVVLTSAQASGTTRVVPANYPTIQAGIQASSSGDTVLVLPGTYLENILIDRDVIVRSAQGPAATIIDGASPADPSIATVVRITAGRVEGFSIANGRGTQFGGTRYGGGVLASGVGVDGPLIRGNWIHDNNVVSADPPQGGGIRVDGVARVVSNRIYHNQVEGSTNNVNTGGSAISVARHVGDGPSLIEANEIFDNHTLAPGRWGAVSGDRSNIRNNVIACNSSGLASAINDGGGTIEGNTIVVNWSTSEPPGPAVWLWHGSVQASTVISNNITDNGGVGLYCNPPGRPPNTDNVIECNNFFANVGGPASGVCSDVIGRDGNIAVAPLYGQGSCQLVAGDWCLEPDSPLLPENSPPGCGLIGARGECLPIGVRDAGGSAPGPALALTAAPNPFFERTTIAFYLSEPGEVNISIYGVLGRKVRTLIATALAAGESEIAWDGRRDDGEPAASGAYVAVIRASGREVTRVLLLVR